MKYILVKTLPYQINTRPILPPIYTEPARNYQLSDLVALLPIEKDLPDRILTLKNHEQVSLINITRNEICNIPDFVNNIKRIYIVLTRVDLNLSGSSSFKQFVDACHQNNVSVIGYRMLYLNCDCSRFIWLGIYSGWSDLYSLFHTKMMVILCIMKRFSPFSEPYTTALTIRKSKA